MLARIDRKTAALVAGSIVLMVGCVVFIIWMFGNIVDFQNEYNSAHKDDKVVTETHTDHSDDNTGTYGPTVGINGKIGMGYDMGGGITLSPSGGLSLGTGL